MAMVRLPILLEMGAHSSSRLFIIDGVISLPIALSGFWMIPDVPEIANPWYLTEEVRSC